MRDDRSATDETIHSPIQFSLRSMVYGVAFVAGILGLIRVLAAGWEVYEKAFLFLIPCLLAAYSLSRYLTVSEDLRSNLSLAYLLFSAMAAFYFFYYLERAGTIEHLSQRFQVQVAATFGVAFSIDRMRSTRHKVSGVFFLFWFGWLFIVSVFRGFPAGR